MPPHRRQLSPEALCFRFVRPSVRTILVNAIFQEHLDGISFNLAQRFTWTQGRTDKNLMLIGQRSL